MSPAPASIGKKGIILCIVCPRFCLAPSFFFQTKNEIPPNLFSTRVCIEWLIYLHVKENDSAPTNKKIYTLSQCLSHSYSMLCLRPKKNCVPSHVMIHGSVNPPMYNFASLICNYICPLGTVL